MKGIKKLDENVISPYRSLTITNPNLPDNSNWQKGTLKCDPENAGLRYKADDNGSYNLFIAGNILAPNTVTSELIMDGTIQTIDLGDKCVTNDKIADRTINHIKLQEQTITEQEMSTESVIERVIGTEAVTEIKIAPDAVTTIKVKDAAITGPKIALNVVGTGHLIDGCVTNDKIMGGAVINEKIAINTIENDRLKDATIEGNKIAPNTITGPNIAMHTITSFNLIDGAVDNRVLADQAVTNEKIAAKTILATNIADNIITSAQIAIQGIDTDNYKDKSVTRNKLADDIGDVIDDAIKYDDEGNVTLLKDGFNACAVTIGSEDVNGKSNGNGSLRVYGSVNADRVYNMAYSDLAEGYVPGEDLEPGDIVELRRDGKVYKTQWHNFSGICVGVVSDEYAQCFGASEEELANGSKVAVGLIGKVHVNIEGPVNFGDKICPYYSGTDGAGYAAQFCHTPQIIGTVLETVEDIGAYDTHKVLCLIRPS